MESPENREAEARRREIEERIQNAGNSILPRRFKPSVALVTHLLTKLQGSGVEEQHPVVHHLNEILRLLRENPEVPAEEAVQEYERRSIPGAGSFGIIYRLDLFDDFDPGLA